MEIAKNLMIILLTGILTENFVLSKFLGICPFFETPKKGHRRTAAQGSGRG